MKQRQHRWRKLNTDFQNKRLLRTGMSLVNGFGSKQKGRHGYGFLMQPSRIVTIRDISLLLCSAEVTESSLCGLVLVPNPTSRSTKLVPMIVVELPGRTVRTTIGIVAFVVAGIFSGFGRQGDYAMVRRTIHTFLSRWGTRESILFWGVKNLSEHKESCPNFQKLRLGIA